MLFVSFLTHSTHIVYLNIHCMQFDRILFYLIRGCFFDYISTYIKYVINAISMQIMCLLWIVISKYAYCSYLNRVINYKWIIEWILMNYLLPASPLIEDHMFICMMYDTLNIYVNIATVWREDKLQICLKQARTRTHIMMIYRTNIETPNLPIKIVKKTYYYLFHCHQQKTFYIKFLKIRKCITYICV